MRTRVFTAGVLGLALGAFWVVPAMGGGAVEVKAKIGKPAPDFTLRDCYGKTFNLSDYKGKTVVLEWVNQYCPVSKGKHRARTMQKTFAKYARDGVVWLGIDSTSTLDVEKNRIYAAEMGLAFPLLNDPDGKVGRTYGARTTPHMFVIDKSGNLVYNGAIDDQGKRNYVAEAIEAVVAGSTVAKAKTRPYGCSVKYKQ